MRLFALLLCVGLLLEGAASASAQSLAAVAKQEEDRRKEVRESGKAYTNKDLKGVPGSPAAPAAPATSATGTAASTGAAATPAAAPVDSKDQAIAGAPATDQAETAGKGEVKNQAYWAGRMKQLREQLALENTYVEAMQSRVNALTTDFANRDDPAQRQQIGIDRQKALTELDRLKKAIQKDTKAISDLEEEARRASVPPGWLR